MMFQITLQKAEGSNLPLINFPRTSYGLDLIDAVRGKEKMHIPFSKFKYYIEEFYRASELNIELGDEFENYIRDSGLFRRTNKITIIVHPEEQFQILGKFIDLKHEIYEVEDDEGNPDIRVRLFYDFNVERFMDWWSEKGYPNTITGEMV